MHDVDMIAMDENLSYECSNKNALFLASKRYKYNAKGEKAGIMRGSFGAVSSISPTIFERVNGYSNEYWGWGGEDDDLYRRLGRYKIKIKRVFTSEIDNWYMIEHGVSHSDEGNGVNPDRFRLKNTAGKRMKRDGLNSLEYKIVQKIENPILEHYLVDVGDKPRTVNIG